MIRDSIPYVRYTIYAIMNEFAAMLGSEEPNCPKNFCVCSMVEESISQLQVLFLFFPTNSVQWNPSITDTFGDQHFVRYSEVSPTQGLPVGVVCVIRLLSTMWLRFPSFPLLHAGREG